MAPPSLYSVDVNLHVSHVSVAPVVLEAHHQRVWLQSTQTDGLRIGRDDTVTQYLIYMF